MIECKNEYRRLYQLAKEAVERGDWKEASKASIDAIAFYQENNAILEYLQEYHFLFDSYKQATEEVWLSDIDLSCKPSQDYEDEAIAYSIRSDLAGCAMADKWVFFLGCSHSKNDEIKDVGMNVLLRLSGLPWTFRPYSKGRRCESGFFTRANKIDNYYDVETKKQGTQIKILIMGWSDNRTMKFKYESHTGKRASYGYSATAKRVNERWIVCKECYQWIS